MITIRDIARIKPGETISDSGTGGVPGFAIRRQGTGAAVFVLQYRWQGRPKKLTLGRAGVVPLDEARKLAASARKKLEDGQDPAAKDATTIGELADRWLAEHVAEKREPGTAAEYRRLVEHAIKPKLGDMRCEALGRPQVAALHHGLRNTPTEANRALAALQAMLNWADSVGAYKMPAEGNPCQPIERFDQVARERYLTGAELGRLGTVLAAHDNADHVAMIRLLIFTGARLSEIRKLRWEQIDEAGARLPRHKTSRKTGPKTVVLPPPARAVLAVLPRVEACPFVFGWLNRDGWQPRSTTWIETPWRKLRTEAGIEDVRLHDLRHSFASVGAASGLGLPIIGRLLGHAQASTTQRYAHVADNPAAAAAEKIAGQIEAQLAGETGAKVVPLRRDAI